MHYYTFNPKDYMSKTHYLSITEDLAYRRMLDYCYLNEKPLPPDIDEVAIVIGMRTHNESIATVLRYFFELTAEGYINDRVVREVSAYREKSDKAKASANARWSKKDSKDNDLGCNANALRDECDSNANNKQITNNKEPLTKEKQKKFSMLDSLVENGADVDLAEDWISVRKVKKARDSERALNMFINQVGKSGQNINTILNLCVVKSWSGFEVDYLRNINISEYQSNEYQPKDFVVEKPEMEWVDF